MAIVVTKYGRMRVIDSDAVVSKALTLYGEWAQDELALLQALIAPGMAVLDVGAFIGTHTVAFSAFCGSHGKVTSFEPRREIFDVLVGNVAMNDCKNVTVLNLGLAEKEFELTLSVLNLEDPSNFGGLALEGTDGASIAATYQSRVITLDSLAPDRLDLIKLDVEGMEGRVLAGAAATIARFRPLILCECNDVDGGSELLVFCRKHGYEAYGYLAPAFNPANFNGNKENIWGDGKELALLLLPSEKVQQSLDKLSDKQLFPLSRIDDLVLPLLFKPQYVPEILEHTPASRLFGTSFRSPLAIELMAELDGTRQLLAKRHEEVSAFDGMIRQRDAELQTLRDESARQQTVNDALLRAIARFDTEVIGLNACVARQNEQIQQAHLESEQAAAQRLLLSQQLVRAEQRLSSIYSSRSWHVTRPLRALARRARGDGPADDTAVLAAEYTTASLNDPPGSHQVAGMATAVAAPHVPPLSVGRLYASLADGTLRQPVIIFDHNGGGGSNAYSREIATALVAQGSAVLRVYCYEAQWFIQRRDREQVCLFLAPSLDFVFDILLASGTRSVIVNSLYGYVDIPAACRGIVNLVHSLRATLDFKVHDFFALCPSPHLSDFEQKYCGVPVDASVCETCLKANNAWYHSWYPVENRPGEIKAWRKPFADLFDAASSITFFDPSSVPILRKDFSFDESKVRVVPHTSSYFTSARAVNIQGPLHVGILGTLSHLKGGHAVRALQEFIEAESLQVPLTVVGQNYMPLSDKVTIYGSYATDDLPDIVEAQGINVIFMATIVPETFSYTISEAMEMGLPIVAFDIGAQGNRLKNYALGKVIPLGASPQMMLAAFESCLKAAQELKK
jgi:FkbM family methyltransferase